MSESITPSELSFEYDFIRLLGEGANGKTWLAKSRQNGELVAIKSLKMSGDPKQIELFIREAETLQSINIEGVPKLHKSIIPKNPYVDPCYIVQEYVMYPSLQSALDEGKKFTESEVIIILEKITEILKQLQTLYSPPIIHRDIKPSNVLCDFDQSANPTQLYLIDFGAVANPQKKTGGSTIAGTFGYMAPEQLLGEAYIQSDFYSLGALALHLLTGVSPVKLDSNMFTLEFDNLLDQEAPTTSPSMRTLLHWLLEPAMEKRPKSAQTLLRALSLVFQGISITPDQLNAQQKQSPHVITQSTMPSILGTILNFFGIHPQPQITWQTCKCNIQRLSFTYFTTHNETNRYTHPFGVPKSDKYLVCLLPKEPALEYTFNVGNKTYCGIEYIDLEVFETLKSNQISYPIQATTRYSVEDPRINQLIFESLDLDIKKLDDPTYHHFVKSKPSE